MLHNYILGYYRLQRAFNYKNKVLVVMFNNSTNTNKTNNLIS